jgi:hypothetical protein
MRKHRVSLWCAVVPLALALAGCGGNDTKTKTKTPTTPPQVDEGAPVGTTSPSKEEASPALNQKASDSKEGTAAEGYGTVKGQIVYGGDPPAPQMIFKAGDPNQKNPEVCAKEDMPDESLVVNAGNKGVQWVMVYINRPTHVKPELKNASGDVEFGQEHCRFKPHVFAYQEGQNVKVTSDDPIAHNTNVQPFKGQQFNPTIPAAPEGGKTVVDGPELPAQPRPISVQCNIHGWMKAYWFVFDHPYFAVTDENGNFEIKDVPAGEQKLVVWQEKIGYGEGKAAGKPITVMPNETTETKLTLQPK